MKGLVLKLSKIIEVGFIEKGTGKHQSNIVYSTNGIAPTVCAAFCVKQPPTEVVQEKSERLMEGVAYWGAFYRKNPQRFVKDYLNIPLKLFQKILIYMMMVSTNFMYTASRGQGKTWLIWY